MGISTNEAKTAVEEINVGERLLTFADADTLQPPGFRIIYYRDKENLEVLARFRPESNVVSINLPHMPSLKKDFDIVADKKNKVGFVAGKVPYSPDEIVSEMLFPFNGGASIARCGLWAESLDFQSSCLQQAHPIVSQFQFSANAVAGQFGFVQPAPGSKVSSLGVNDEGGRKEQRKR